MPESRLKVWYLAARPKTLPAATAPVIIGTAMAVQSGGFHLASAVAALLGALLIQIGTNYANDYFDYKKGTDRPDRLGPTRVTQAGLVSPGAMKMATIVVFALAVVAGMYLVWRGGWAIALIGVVSILFGVFYTAGRYALGYTGLADLFVLAFFGPVAVGGTYYVQTLDVNWIVLIAGISPGLFSVAILTVNNLRDIDSDRNSGKRTLPVRFGVAFARGEYLASIVIAAVIPAVIFLFTGTGGYATICILVVPLAVSPLKKVFTVSGVILNDVLAATGRLLLIYALLFAVGWNL